MNITRQLVRYKLTTYQFGDKSKLIYVLTEINCPRVAIRFTDAHVRDWSAPHAPQACAHWWGQVSNKGDHIRDLIERSYKRHGNAIAMEPHEHARMSTLYYGHHDYHKITGHNAQIDDSFFIPFYATPVIYLPGENLIYDIWVLNSYCNVHYGT